MSRSLFLLATSLVLAIAAGCGDDGKTVCGPGDAPPVGLVVGGPVTLTYGNLGAGLNNDCPDPAAPAGIVSMTINGPQTDGTGLITLCVPRPDLLVAKRLALGPDVAGSEIHVVDVIGAAAGCTFDFDKTTPLTGTGTATGLCRDGADPAGFALDVDGTLSLDRTCGATVDKVTVTLRGRVAVVAQ